MFLGDSVGYGINLPFEDTLPSILSKKMKNYEFFNFSVPGYDIRQYVAVLKHKILKLKPDIVFFLICLNDFEGSTAEFDKMKHQIEEKLKIDPDYLNKYSVISDFYSNSFKNAFVDSHLIRFLSLKLMSISNVSSVDSLNLNEKIIGDKLIKLLESVEEFSRNNLFKYYLVFLPQGGNEHSDKFLTQMDTIKSNSIPYLDLYSEAIQIFNDPNRKNEASGIFLPDDPLHFNEKGHKFLADLLISHKELW